jgi:DNA-3-methyladenine glycosylase
MKRELSHSLQGSVDVVAPKLLGALLSHEVDGTTLSGRIVEVEAYGPDDVASHSYKGKTPRNASMFGPAGHLYVYFTYGMHYCCNVVIGSGAAVLIRAIEPVTGIEAMCIHRNGRSGVELTNGPAKVCRALRIDKTHDGHDLSRPPLTLTLPAALILPHMVVSSPRIGIRQAVDVPWRFYVRGNPYVSVSPRNHV